MIAFDRTMLDNTLLIESAEDLKDGKFITNDQFKAAKTVFPTLKTQRNIFIRIAFLLLGSFCYSSCTGVLALIFFSAGDNAEALSVILALIGIAAAEMLARNHFYAHGLDDAAIIGFLLAVGTAVSLITDSTALVLVGTGIASAVCALRYLHTLSVIVTVGCIAGLIGYLTFEFHLIPEFYLTIVLFLFAVVLFLAHRTFIRHPSSGYYKWPLLALEFCSLLIGYFSVNYLVVRELAQDMMGFEVVPGGDIPMAGLFYILTFAIPILYLVFAVKTKNRLMLWTGLFTFGFAIFTIRFYYHVIPTEWALVIGGIVLGISSLFVIRRLKGKESGITFEKDRMHDSKALSIAQAVIVNSHAIQNVPSKGPMEFGGGGFSGGGAGENF